MSGENKLLVKMARWDYSDLGNESRVADSDGNTAGLFLVCCKEWGGGGGGVTRLLPPPPPLQHTHTHIFVP